MKWVRRALGLLALAFAALLAYFWTPDTDRAEMLAQYGAGLAPLVLLATALVAPRAEAQSVLRVAKGLASNNVHIFIDRAVVLESTVRFLEVSVANPKIADVSPLSDRSICCCCHATRSES